MIIIITDPKHIISLLIRKSTGRGRRSQRNAHLPRQPQWASQLVSRIKKGQRVMSEDLFTKVFHHVYPNLPVVDKFWYESDRNYTDFLAYGREKAKNMKKSLQRQRESI